MKKILLILMIILVTTETYSQWVWQNPKPTGNDILNIKFINEQTGWFVGNCGTIFKTNDGGQNWFPILTKYTCDFTAVDPIDENNIWIVGHGYSTERTLCDPSFKVLNSSDGGNSWSLKLNGATFFCDSVYKRFRYYLEDVCFVDNNTGFVVGDSGMILKTTNGGTSWTLQQQSKQHHFKSVQFFDAQLGFVAGGSGFITIGHLPRYNDLTDDGVILKTMDGGNTWQTVFSDTVTLFDMYFLNPSIGWAVGVSQWFIEFGEIGYRLSILKTTDGGTNWGQINVDRIPALLYNIFFIDELNGWATGSAGRILKTTDGGKYWTTMYPATYSLVDVYSFNTTHIIAVGQAHVIRETTNGGISWFRRDTSFLSSGSINSIHFINPDTGMLVQYGEVFRTTDKGRTWLTKGHMRLWDITCYGKKDCWGVGYGGTIVYSSDAGSSWVNQVSGVSAWLKDVKFVTSRIGWAVGDGDILKTTDGGANWLWQDANQGGTLLAIIAQDAQRAWVYSAQSNNVKTTNGGLTWDAQGPYWGIYFINPDTGWVKKDDTLYRTFDGGKNLQKIGPGGLAYSKTQFTDINHGWTFGFENINSTSDGGYNWYNELMVKIYQTINCGHFIDSIHGWAATRGGGLIRYGYPELLTSVDELKDYLTHNFQLYQNYPNPFNLNTTISYQIKSKSYITIKIYDILGKEVRILESEEKEAGSYEIFWDGRNNQGKEVASGIYFYRLHVLPSYFGKANSIIQVKKMLLIK